MTATGKRLLSDILAVILGLCVLAWTSVFAYANWLRFSSPRFPDPATGHTVFIKAVKGVYYATPLQAWWAQGVLLPIGVAAGIAFLFRSWALTGAAPRIPSSTMKLANAAFVVIILGLLFLGDYAVAFLTTGSLTPPASP